MYQQRYPYLPPPFCALVLFLVLIPCNLPGKTAAPTPSPGLAAKPDPGLSPAPLEPDAEQGLTRAKPFPHNQVVSIPGWKIQVLEIQRGGAAWQLMQTGGDTIPVPPAGAGSIGSQS